MATFRTVLSLGGQGAELATRREPGERVSPNRAALPTGQRRGRRTSEEKAGAPTQEDGLTKGNASKSGLCRAGILRMEKKKKVKKKIMADVIKLQYHDFTLIIKKGPSNCSLISFAFFA